VGKTGEASNGVAPEHAYTAELTLAAPPARVFSALATPDGLATWWTPIVSGSLAPGTRSTRSSMVEWTCLGHSGHPEWGGTTLEFRLIERGLGETALFLRHAGLEQRLACFGASKSDWDRVLTDLRETVESDGPPFADLDAAA